MNVESIKVCITQCNFKTGKTFKVTNVRTVSNFYAGEERKRMNEWGKISGWVPSLQLYDGEDINLIPYPLYPPQTGFPGKLKMKSPSFGHTGDFHFKI